MGLKLHGCAFAPPADVNFPADLLVTMEVLSLPMLIGKVSQLGPHFLARQIFGYDVMNKDSMFSWK